MGFKPLADNVLIKVSDVETKTKSGLFIPGNASANPTDGVVVAVGSGTLVKDGSKFPIEVEVGQRVLFKENAGVIVNIDGEDHMVLREYDILGVL
jgi:chaperonin GroES